MSSSLTPSSVVQHDHREHLLTVLGQVPDPRDPRGVRYRLAGVLAVAVCAVLAGARSFTAIGEWASELPGDRLAALGLTAAPVESTMRTLFARLDTAALDRQLGVFAWTRTAQVAGRRVITIDGKTLRGARSTVLAAPHLIAALDHATGVVLGQVAVAAKSNEIPAVRDLPTGFTTTDLHPCVITVDAIHTQTDTAQTILAAGADYVFTVKGNQPRLLARLKALPFNHVLAYRATTGHGRRATRTLRVLQAPAWTGFTGATQVVQLRRTVTKGGTRTVEVVYLITSASHQCAPPAVLADWIRQHWHIENRLHWVRDVTYDEDRSQTRTGADHTSWPACATLPSPCSDSPAGPPSPADYDITPETHNDPSHSGGWLDSRVRGGRHGVDHEGSVDRADARRHGLLAAERINERDDWVFRRSSGVFHRTSCVPDRCSCVFDRGDDRSADRPGADVRRTGQPADREAVSQRFTRPGLHGRGAVGFPDRRRSDERSGWQVPVQRCPWALHANLRAEDAGRGERGRGREDGLRRL